MTVMTDDEMFQKYHRDLDRLKLNREKVPIELLTTRFKKGYDALLEELRKDADWFADMYLFSLKFPRHPDDETGNQEVDAKIKAIIQEENEPGHLRDQWRIALTEHMDEEELLDLSWKRYDRCLREAYMPYFNRHCRWVGPSDNRWIYSEILRKWWLPPRHDSRLGHRSGTWINRDYAEEDMRFPPDIGPDPLSERNEQQMSLFSHIVNTNIHNDNHKRSDCNG